MRAKIFSIRETKATESPNDNSEALALLMLLVLTEVIVGGVESIQVVRGTTGRQYERAPGGASSAGSTVAL